MQTVYKPGSFITFVDKKATTFTKDSPFFSKVVELYKKKDWETIKNYFDIKNYVTKYSNGRVKVGDNFVLYDDKEIHSEVGKRILAFIKEGIDITPLVKFLENVMANEHEEIRTGLFSFLENNQLALTEDGGFLAFKLVGNEFEPFYQGKSCVERYTIGSIVTYPREKIQFSGGACNSVGLYVGNKTYWNASFDENERYKGEGNMLIVKVMPQNVCSSPSEGVSKIRVCELEVISEYEKVRKEANSVVFTVREYSTKELNEIIHNTELPDDVSSEEWPDDIIEEAVEHNSGETEYKEYSPNEIKELEEDADKYIEKIAKKIVRKLSNRRDSSGRFLPKPKRDKFGRFIKAVGKKRAR